MAMTRAMVYATSGPEMNSRMVELEGDWEDTYPQFVAYMSGLLLRREEWALCFRDTLPNRGHNTNNVVEAAFRVLKDSILHRLVTAVRLTRKGYIEMVFGMMLNDVPNLFPFNNFLI